MSNDDDLGGLKDLAKGRDELALCRAFHQLSPVGGPFCGTAWLMPAVPLKFIDALSTELGRTTFFKPAPRRSLRCSGPSRLEPKGNRLQKRKPRPGLHPSMLARPLLEARIKPSPAPAVLDRIRSQLPLNLYVH